MAAVMNPAVGSLANSWAKDERTATKPTPNNDIIDIRGDREGINLKRDLEQMLDPEDNGPRQLPTLLLYDEKGLQLFERITYLEEYYLTNNEIELLQASSVAIAQHVPEGAAVVELGSGNLRKVRILLQAFEDAGKPIDYYALDLNRDELVRTLDQVPPFRFVSCHGLFGTYDDGLEWLEQLGDRPKCIIHLGSSIGNFGKDEASKFLKSFSDILQPQDSMLIAVDSCEKPDKVYHAYNGWYADDYQDAQGVTHRFILNGLVHANRLYDQELFHLPDWRVIGEYVYDAKGGRHRAFVSPIREVTVLGARIKPYERIQIEHSLKYSAVESDNLWKAAGLTRVDQWTHRGEHGLHLLKRAKMPFSLDPSVYAASVLPSLDDWKGIWAAWDTVTRDMLPEQELGEKPIKLRNACIFYLGHIPTFLDIQLTKATGAAPTEPASYAGIFERGIDPDVDNPEKCHDHSEVPDEWPPLAEILSYQEGVRRRLTSIYAGGQKTIPRRVGRAVWLGFEHELMHLETLLYMMLQSNKTLPPPHAPRPDFERMAREARAARVANKWFAVPAQTVSVGLDDPENGVDPTLHFGWDNEKPVRQVEVKEFQASGRPITNEEYAQYMYKSNIQQAPASWVYEKSANGTNGTNGHVNGVEADMPDSFLEGISVRTVYGNIPLKWALDWPVFASYDELAGCASWMGGRIPTVEEARSIYAFVDNQKKALLQGKLTKKVPAVNGHLVNDGVEETPPSRGAERVGNSSKDLFIDLAGANVGFQNWHPVPVTSKGGSLAGQSDMGGVWEWTSSLLRRHEGFEPMPLYPGYTADFFDEKHNVVLGGSWATHPRIAGRKSFVNWYQRNYPFVWAGARLVKDC